MSSSAVAVKRLDHIFDKDTRTWSYCDTKGEPSPRVLPGGKTPSGADVWTECCFVVIREMPADPDSTDEPDVVVTIKSPHLRAVCKRVIGNIANLGSWTIEPLELSIYTLLWVLPLLKEYSHGLSAKEDRSSDEKQELLAVNALIAYLREDHSSTVASIDSLLAQKEIAFELLPAILIPGTIFLCVDVAEESMSAVRLRNYDEDSGAYTLHCESIDAIERQPGHWQQGAPDNILERATQTKKFGRVHNVWRIPYFEGVVKINTLPLYPLQYHSKEASLREALVARGRKWAGLHGMHHAMYKGVAVYNTSRVEVDSRIVIDRDTFQFYNSDYRMSNVHHEAELSAEPSNAKDELSDDDLLLAPPTVYGLSLTDLLWLEFSVTEISPIEWSEDPLTGLILPENQRDTLRCLVEAHNSKIVSEQNRRRCLVINLFGPPGVGKSQAAEAIAEHLKRPFHRITVGELGDHTSSFESTLKRSLHIVTCWNAILLIDEADIFLEHRSVQDVQRNAMISIFLRQLEQFRGTLLLTTSRVRSFDPVFLSRINLSLNFHELNKKAKLRIWQAVLSDLGINSGAFTGEELDGLVNRKVNGHQIDSAARTAALLADGRGEKLRCAHVLETLDAMEGFEREFTAMSRSENWYL